MLSMCEKPLFAHFMFTALARWLDNCLGRWDRELLSVHVRGPWPPCRDESDAEGSMPG